MSRAVTEDMLDAIRDARVAMLADTARFTSREREVFRRCLSGATIDAIAKAMGLAPRTVKFHVANLLAKAGAESRVDLIRMVL